MPFKSASGRNRPEVRSVEEDVIPIGSRKGDFSTYQSTARHVDRLASSALYPITQPDGSPLDSDGSTGDFDVTINADRAPKVVICVSADGTVAPFVLGKTKDKVSLRGNGGSKYHLMVSFEGGIPACVGSVGSFEPI